MSQGRSQQQKRDETLQGFEDLVAKFQAASSSLEISYKELQKRAETLTVELAEERQNRIHLERLAAMGEMAMELAHEIRNPLGSIELYASMMDGEYAGQIVQSVRLLNHAVTNILQFGKSVTPRIERLPVARLLEGVRGFLAPLAWTKSVTLETSAVDGEISADPELLHRMFLNLVLNALRETPKGGRIRLTAEFEGPWIRFTVEDTGKGVPPAILDRIFDPLFSARRDGCGLGLPIVKRIVEAHGGTIRVDSSLTGTIFTIRLSALPPSAATRCEVLHAAASC